MTKSMILDPHPREYERFLFARVGDDRRGHAVTVLSTLARLGLDPWDETAELVTLSREAAGVRLGLRLSKCQDIPTLARDHVSVARELSQLLPQGSVFSPPGQIGAVIRKGQLLPSAAIWMIIAVAIALVQVLVMGGPGGGK